MKLTRKYSRREKVFIAIFLAPFLLAGLLLFVDKVQSYVSKKHLSNVYSEIKLPNNFHLQNKAWGRRDIIDDVYHWDYTYSTDLPWVEAALTFQESLQEAGYVVGEDSYTFNDRGSYSETHSFYASNSKKNVYMRVALIFLGNNSSSLKSSKPDRIAIRLENGAGQVGGQVR